MNTPSYLDAALQGKNDGWRYLLGYLIILPAWMLLGSLPIVAYAIYLQFDGDPASTLSATGFVGADPLIGFLVTLISFIPLLLSVLLVVRFLHGRPIQTLFSAHPTFRWKRFWLSLSLWFILCLLIAAVEASLYPGRYALSDNLTAILPFILPALILIPIQTSAEELFSRGYILQNLGLKIKNIWILSLLSGVIFTIPHLGNPEMEIHALLMPLFYFSFGFFAAFITIRDGGLELALGIHAANNLFSLVVNYQQSALPTPSAFRLLELDPIYGVCAPIIAMIIFYLLLRGARKP